MSSHTLYEIGEDLRALDELLSEVGGDVSEADAEQAIDQFLAENRDALATKLDGYGAVLRAMEADAAFCEAEAARLSERATVRRNNVKRMKARLCQFFEAHGIPKVETPRFRFALTANGGKAPLSVTIPPDALPEPYRVERVVYSADNDAIRAALEAGELLDFATLGARGNHIRVK